MCTLSLIKLNIEAAIAAQLAAFLNELPISSKDAKNGKIEIGTQNLAGTVCITAFGPDRKILFHPRMITKKIIELSNEQKLMKLRGRQIICPPLC